MTLPLYGNSVALDNYVENDEWEVSRMDATKRTKDFQCCENGYEQITMRFTLKVNCYILYSSAWTGMKGPVALWGIHKLKRLVCYLLGS